MTKDTFLKNFKIVIEPAIERIEIPLSSFAPFVEAVRDVADDYDIHTEEVEQFIERHREEFEGLIGQKVSLESKLGLS